MTEKEETKTIASRILGMIPGDMRDMIGIYYGVFLFMAAPAVIGLCLYALFQFAHSLSEENAQCWELSTQLNKIYKINRCTGEVVKIEPEAISPK